MIFRVPIYKDCPVLQSRSACDRYDIFSRVGGPAAPCQCWPGAQQQQPPQRDGAAVAAAVAASTASDRALLWWQ